MHMPLQEADAETETDTEHVPDHEPEVKGTLKPETDTITAAATSVFEIIPKDGGPEATELNDGMVTSDFADGSHDADTAELVSVVHETPSLTVKLKRPKVQKPQAAAARLLVEYSPAAEKIVDEILQNMADRPVKDPLMRKIIVTVDEARGVITARNDGYGILIEKPDKTTNPGAPDEYWPTILYTRIMAGGNFVSSADVAHHQGGRNGIGAKASNICSRRFKVTVGDSVNKKLFTQEWRDGMTSTAGPSIKAYAAKVGFVEVDFEPDMEFFGFSGPGFTPDFAALIRSRVWELAAVTPDAISVTLDGIKLPIKNLSQYTALYTAGVVGSPKPAHSVQTTPGGVVVWDVTVLPAGRDGVTADCVAFVNGVRCGSGKHVQHLYTRLAAMLEDAVRKKTKTATKDVKDSVVKPSHVQASTFVVLNVRVDAPRFTSQNKECLDSPAKDWGFKWQPDEAFVKRVATLCADAVADRIVLKADAGAVRDANKKTAGSKSVNLPKYEPAGDAGKPNTEAMLLLAEGDSAKSLAMAGRAVTGSSLIGVYCLKGKPLNTRDSTVCKAMGNEVLNNVAKILGLEYGRTYTTPDDLRRLNYRYMVLMADQDYDGGHIVGLMVNWIETMWPSLLHARPDFIKRFATPIVVARRRKGVPVTLPAELKFLSLPTFTAWLDEDASRSTTYAFAYYKGLGGHSSAAGREYFSSLDDYVVSLTYDVARDRETLLDFFDKSRADARRRMLETVFDASSFVDYTQRSVSVKTYLLNETLHYSHDHNIRNITDMDGMKRTQRKVIYAVRKHVRPGQVVKLQPLAMQAAKDTHYHHGDASLYSTMVGMGQAHVGTNNVNLLSCDGQFGSRHASRDVFTSPRYLSTGLTPITNKLFRPEDDAILTYRVEDGAERVEPTVFAPVVPIDMLNGCSGVGTGWRTEMPAFYPPEVIAVFRARVQGREDWAAAAAAMLPWYDGFSGGVHRTATAWKTTGLYHLEETDTQTNIVISELPVGMWIDNYYERVLAPLLVGNKDGFVTRILSDTTDTRVRYTLVCDSDAFTAAAKDARTDAFVKDGRNFFSTADPSIGRQADDVYTRAQRRYTAIETLLKLESSTTWQHMHRFDVTGAITHYASMPDLVEAYYRFRMPLYEERRVYGLDELDRTRLLLQNKLRFIKEVSDGVIEPRAYADEAAWWLDLAARGYVHDDDDRVKPHVLKTVSDIPTLTASVGLTTRADSVDGIEDVEDVEDVKDLKSATAQAASAAPVVPVAVTTYRYLTGMRMSSMTQALYVKLQKEVDRIDAEYETLAATTPQALWLADLDELEAAYASFSRDRASAAVVVMPTALATVKRGAADKKRARPSSSKTTVTKRFKE
jgi:DNA topoisomerase-2